MNAGTLRYERRDPAAQAPLPPELRFESSAYSQRYRASSDCEHPMINHSLVHTLEGMQLAKSGFAFLPRLQASRHPSSWLVCWINVLETLETIRV
jgi:hypothetical protein